MFTSQISFSLIMSWIQIDFTMIQRLFITRPIARAMAQFSSYRYSSQQAGGKYTKEPTKTIEPDGKDQGPIKFTSSDAHLNYKAVRNFYGDDRNLPPSHNIVLFVTAMSGITYLMFIRDDIDDNQGTASLFKPVHETLPHLAIPMLQNAIIENRRFGLSTKKMEEKLAEYMKEPEKYGGLDPPPSRSFREILFGSK